MNELGEDGSSFGASYCKRFRLDNDDIEPLAKHGNLIELNGDGADLSARENDFQDLCFIVAGKSRKLSLGL